MGQQVDAHAQRLDFGHRLEHLHGKPCFMQTQGGDKPTDSGAGDYYFVAGWHPLVAKLGIGTVMQRVK